VRIATAIAAVAPIAVSATARSAEEPVTAAMRKYMPGREFAHEIGVQQ
jgi:hypothetical protein